MILAISDLHLGATASNTRGIYQFIDNFLEPNRSDIDHLFLLGDIFDLWRRPNAEVIVENQRLLDRLVGLDIKTHYLFGNHDLVTRDIGEWLSTTEGLYGVSSWELMQRSVGLIREVEAVEYDGLNLRFCHGHQIDYWIALDFYEVFCKAMCSTEASGNTPDEEWDAVLQSLPEFLPEHREWIQQATDSVKDNLIGTLAATLQEPDDKGKIDGLEEWNILAHFASTNRFTEGVKPSMSLGFAAGVERVVNDLTGRFVSLANEGTDKTQAAIDNLVSHWVTLLDRLREYQTRDEVPKTLLRNLSVTKRLVGELSVGLREYEFLIRGHGHRPYVDESTMMADPGCWLGSNGSFLVISNGQVRAMRWKS